MELIIESPETIDKPAGEFLKLFDKHRIFAFYGEMGVGKTTFIKAICRAAGIKDLVSSPSFALIYEYISESGQFFYHFDLYRIKEINELYDIGYEDYFYGDGICLIEWPERAEELLPPECVRVYFNERADGSRLLLIKFPLINS